MPQYLINHGCLNTYACLDACGCLKAYTQIAWRQIHLFSHLFNCCLGGCLDAYALFSYLQYLPIGNFTLFHHRLDAYAQITGRQTRFIFPFLITNQFVTILVAFNPTWPWFALCQRRFRALKLAALEYLPGHRIAPNTSEIIIFRGLEYSQMLISAHDLYRHQRPVDGGLHQVHLLPQVNDCNQQNHSHLSRPTMASVTSSIQWMTIVIKTTISWTPLPHIPLPNLPLPNLPPPQMMMYLHPLLFSRIHLVAVLLELLRD